jgi:hypothetical protein
MVRWLNILGIFGILLLYVWVKSPQAMAWLQPRWFNFYALGDLYRYSFLPQYKDTTQVLPPYPSNPSGKENLHLFVFGDSFGAPFEAGHFPLVSGYSYANWNHVGPSQISVSPQPGARNILLLQCSEKHVLLRFSRQELHQYKLPVIPGKTGGFVYQPAPKDMLAHLNQYLSRPQVTEQNINLLFFSNPMVLRLKETKAVFNQQFLGKVATEVCEWPEKQMLLQTMTLDPKYIYMSGYRQHSESELEQIARNIQSLRQYYLNRGFQEVWLALIPNPASILVPEWAGQPYNQVLGRLERRFPDSVVVSVENAFRKTQLPVFRKGDSHWNLHGAGLWMDAVNRKLANQID